MNIDIKQLGYSVRPYKDTCWQLYEWRDERENLRDPSKMVSAGWIAIDIYPSTVEHALLKVLELTAKKRNKTFESVTEAVEEIRRIKDEIVDAL